MTGGTAEQGTLKATSILVCFIFIFKKYIENSKKGGLQQSKQK
jgi:hypothetical protein